MASSSTMKMKGPQQKRVIDQDVILLRKIDMRSIGAGILDRIAKTALRPGEYEADQPWFTDGFVAGEHPRDALVAQAIMNSTLGFAIARTDSGEILAEFEKTEVERAERVVHSASVNLAIDVALKETDEDDE